MTNLRGADLLILSSPYYDVPRGDIVSNFDQGVLAEFMADGGAILFMSNPYFFEDNMRNYSGNNPAMSDFMSIGTGLSFSTSRSAIVRSASFPT